MDDSKRLPDDSKLISHHTPGRDLEGVGESLLVDVLEEEGLKTTPHGRQK